MEPRAGSGAPSEPSDRGEARRSPVVTSLEGLSPCLWDTAHAKLRLVYLATSWTDQTKLRLPSPPEVPPSSAMSVIPSPNPFIHDSVFHEDESPQERSRREGEEARAKAVSDAIDEQIKQDKVAFKRYQKAIKILLLGQSESGQSTSVPCHTHFRSLSNARVQGSPRRSRVRAFPVYIRTSFRPGTTIRFPAQVCIQCVGPRAKLVEDCHVSAGPTSAHSTPNHPYLPRSQPHEPHPISHDDPRNHE